MNKTLSQIITEQGQENVFGTILDSATQQELIDYFYYRYVCDNDKFIHFFQRNMKQYKKQYNGYLRVENIEFDPMVTRYLERQVIETKAAQGTETETGTEGRSRSLTNGGSVTIKTDNIETGSGNTNRTGSGTSDRTDSNSNSQTSTNSENHEDRARNLLSVFPQANVSAATSGSLDDNVSYAYATQMTDNKSKGNSSGTDTTEGSSSGRENISTESLENTTASNRNVLDGTQVQTNNTTSNGTDNLTIDKTKANSGSENSDIKERLTGRENYDSATLLEHARDYIRDTNAFMFLVSKLDKCFIGNLRYGED